ncbi:HpcH/HpaI aldolase/citrate lyase family protein [Bordetella hinzii]|uniref:HpcH/HpaI aldolase/citrate lyase family protein n=1 Tax=Bordetella hinzii TaxID=103855 RepID=UPI0004599E4D|nr:CoA ester lyase [Bordetella hinzii]KCB33766.1 HpcH/HpaI aldolase/citrate lyase family protein [Bordetella hinzii CA90 BAL1384]
MSDRSYLFVPGDRPERFDKALQSGAHVVIIDLEDAVAPQHKDSAREAVGAWLRTTPAQVCLRINPAATPWYHEDCALLALPAVTRVMLPKAQDPAELAALAGRLGPAQRILPLIETVAGSFQLAGLAQAPKVERLAFGSYDFMFDSGIQEEKDALDAVRTQLVLHSRHAGLPPPIDGVSLAIDDAAQLQADVRRAKRWGLGAKLCIHPRQVSAVNAGFAPTEAEQAWARRVADALASAPLGAVAVDGKLVDKPIAKLAQAILDEARRLP